jgi:hypothetical protein
VLRAELEADRDAARLLAHHVGEAAVVVEGLPVGETAGRDRGGALGQAPHLGDASHHLVAREVTAGAGLGALTALEVEGLHLLQQVEAPAEAGGGELVEVAAVLGLLLREHPALAGADPGAAELGTARECRLRLG